jgi:hypothetical protein
MGNASVLILHWNLFNTSIETKGKKEGALQTHFCPILKCLTTKGYKIIVKQDCIVAHTVSLVYRE